MGLYDEENAYKLFNEEMLKPKPLDPSSENTFAEVATPQVPATTEAPSTAPNVGNVQPANILTKDQTFSDPRAPGKAPVPGSEYPKNAYADYWGQPVFGKNSAFKMPLDQFVQLAGMMGNAFAPDTPMGRIGAYAAKMGGDAYSNRMQQEYEEPIRRNAWEFNKIRLDQAKKEQLGEDTIGNWAGSWKDNWNAPFTSGGKQYSSKAEYAKANNLSEDDVYLQEGADLLMRYSPKEGLAMRAALDKTHDATGLAQLRLDMSEKLAGVRENYINWMIQNGDERTRIAWERLAKMGENAGGFTEKQFKDYMANPNAPQWARLRNPDGTILNAVEFQQRMNPGGNQILQTSPGYGDPETIIFNKNGAFVYDSNGQLVPAPKDKIDAATARAGAPSMFEKYTKSIEWQEALKDPTRRVKIKHPNGATSEGIYIKGKLYDMNGREYKNPTILKYKK